MTEKNGAIGLILALVFLNAALCIIPTPCYSAPAIMQISNTTTTTTTVQPSRPSNYSTVIPNSATKRDLKHEPLDQMAEEQRLALQIITTTDIEDSGSDRGVEKNKISPSASTNAHHKEDNNNNSFNGAVSFDDQYNHMEAQLKRNQETLNGAGGEKLKRIVINLDSLMSNGSNLPHEKGTKLTIGFSPADGGGKSEASGPRQQNINSRQNEGGSSRDNDRNGDKNYLMMKSTSKKKEANPTIPNAKKVHSQGNGEASQKHGGGGGGTTMRSAIREAVRKQGGIPTMVMSEIEFGKGGAGGEPRIKFMVNSEAIDMMHHSRANNIPEAPRPLQSSESAISDASLQEAIDTLSGEIESLEKQLDGGGGGRRGFNNNNERDHNDGGNAVSIDVSSSSNNNRHQLPGHHHHRDHHQQQHSLAVRELRDQRHTGTTSTTTSAENSVDGGGKGYYGQLTSTLTNRPGKALVGREDARDAGGQVQGPSDDDGGNNNNNNNENYASGAGWGGIRASDNNQDENDDDSDGGENRERSSESAESVETSSLGDKSSSVMIGRDSHVQRHHRSRGSGGGGENSYDSSSVSRGHSNNNNDNNIDDSEIQNYETRAAASSSSDKLSGSAGHKLESMNNPARSSNGGHHRLQPGELGDSDGFTVSQVKPLLMDSSNLFNEQQIEPTGQQQHLVYYENKSNDMSASVAPDGSAPNPTTNNSSATKKLANQQKRQQQKQQVQAQHQPPNNIESENKMDERVARILDRLKLYTTKDQLMKVARDLQNNYPNSAGGDLDDSLNMMKMNGGGGDFGTVNGGQPQMQQQQVKGLPQFVRQNHQVSLMDGPLKMPVAHLQRQNSPWPMGEMLAAGMNANEGGAGEELSMDEVEMARKQISASMQASGVDNIESLLSLASSSSPGRDGAPIDKAHRPSPSPADREPADIRSVDGPKYGSTIDERKRMLEDGIKLLNEFRARQMRLKSMEDGHPNNNQIVESARPSSSSSSSAAQQQKPPHQVPGRDRADGSGRGGPDEYDNEKAHQGVMQNSLQYNSNQEEQVDQGQSGAYEVTNPRQQHVVIVEPSGGSKEYETSKDLADTMENNERNFEDARQRADGSRKSRRYVVDENGGGGEDDFNNSHPDSGNSHDDTSEASESNQQESIGILDQKNEALLRREGQVELKALEQIIDELVRRERKD